LSPRKDSCESSYSYQASIVCLISGSIGTKRWDGTPIYIGYENHIGNKQFEVDNEIPRAEMPTITGSAEEHDDAIEIVSSQEETAPFVEAKRHKNEVIDVDATRDTRPTHPAPAPAVEAASSMSKRYVAPASFYAPAQTKVKAKGPLYVLLITLTSIAADYCFSRYDPEAEGAVVMKRPDAVHIAKYNKKYLSSKLFDTLI
jgi:DNA repair and recombination protein RAD54B